jgi:hypothetical protein
MGKSLSLSFSRSFLRNYWEDFDKILILGSKIKAAERIQFSSTLVQYNPSLTN